MKKRLIALLLLIALLIPTGIASAASWYRVNTSSLQLRILPSESAQVLDSYRRDFAMTVLSTNSGWSYVKMSNGREGYVQSKFIAKASSYAAWVTKDNTNLREGPSGDFSATALLAKGKKVSVLSHGSQYDYCYVPNFGYGYIVNSLLSKKYVKPSGNSSESTNPSGGDYYAWVVNAGNRKVNLRQYASQNAPIIAQYSPGTMVYVISHGKTWDKVNVSGKIGYMMTQFLTRSAPAPTPTPAPSPTPQAAYTAYVVTPNKGYVNVRKGPGEYANAYRVNYGEAVTVLQHNAKWDYIQYKGKRGYVQNKYLQLTMPSDVPLATPVVTATAVPAVPYVATITSPDGKSVNFHKQPGLWSSNVDGVGRLDVGTRVKVLAFLTGNNKGWARVMYKNKYTGYVMTKYLR